MTINFFQRARGKEKRLYARLTHDKKSTEILLDHYFTSKVKSEQYCDKVKQDLVTIYNQQLQSNRPYDVVAVKMVYTTRYKVHNLLEVFSEYITKKIKPQYDAGEMSHSGFRKYEVCYNHLKDFLQCRHLDDINIASIDTAFIDDFDAYLRQFNQHNSIIKQMLYFRCVMNYAKNIHGYILRNPFDQVELRRRKKHPVYLEVTELLQIFNKNNLIERLDKVKDLFLFQCFTGLSYADLAKFNQHAGQQQTFTINRTKTNEVAIVYFYDIAKMILDKYHNQLPVISNVKLNAYLKELADLCGIEKKLTTHVARHTFATTVNLNSGVPLEVVQTLLGHGSIKQTQHYARLQTSSVIKHCTTNNSALNKLFVEQTSFTTLQTHKPISSQNNLSNG